MPFYMVKQSFFPGCHLNNPFNKSESQRRLSVCGILENNMHALPQGLLGSFRTENREVPGGEIVGMR